MSSFHRLLRILEKELSYQEKLLEVLSSERAAIVKLEKERIDSLAEQKEKMLEQVRRVEGERNAVIAALMPSIPAIPEEIPTLSRDKAPKPVKFAVMIEACKDKSLRADLEHVAKELKSVFSTVRALNEQNGLLIRQSLGLIASTISILRSQPESDLPTYGRRGTMGAKKDEPDLLTRSRSLSRSA